MTKPLHHPNGANELRRLFFQQWLRAPLRTASIVPSGIQLAQMVARAARIARDTRILELGGGTGALTAGLLASGASPARLDVVENNPVFVDALRRRFPDVRIIATDATVMSSALKQNVGQYGAVISGLPLLAMNPRVQKAILSEVFALLAPGGMLVQFTYSPFSPIAPGLAKQLKLRATRVALSLRNLPPAWIFRIERA